MDAGERLRSPAYWRVQERLSPTGRRLTRRVVDTVASGAFGSVQGGRPAGAAVAVTFDDGPDPATTPRLLDLLAEEGTRATFFVLAGRAEAHPELAGRLVAEGHEVGLHGPDHRPLTSVPAGDLTAHLRAGRDRLAAVLGRPVTLFRPPYGSQSLRTYLAARRCGLRVVVWSADAEDWLEQPAADVARRALARLGPGGILLLHDTLAPAPSRPVPTTTVDRVEAARLVLSGIRERGWRATTVADLTASGEARTLWLRP